MTPGFWACTTALARRNLLVKWRRGRQTLTEVLTPLFFLVLVVLARLLITPVSLPEVMDDPDTHVLLSTSAAHDLDAALARHSSLRIAITSTNATIALALRDAMRSHFPTRSESVVVSSDAMALAADGALLAGVVVEDRSDRLEVVLRMRRESVPDVDVVVDVQPDAGLDVRRCMRYVDSMFASLQATVGAALVSVVGRSGRYALPDPVRARAYPTPGRTLDPFAGLLDGIGGLYLISAFIGFATKFLFVLVQEKENGQRQYLKVMGVGTAAIWASWTFVYVALTLVTSMLGAGIIVLSGALIPARAAPALVLLMTSYCAALMAFALASSVFFEQAKSAAQFSGLVVFLLYSPRLIVANLDSWIALLLSPPIAFDHGFRALVRGGSAAWASALLAAYAVAVAVLALYLDLVVPSDFGVRREWDFPCRRRRPSRRPSAMAPVDDQVSLPLMERRPSGQEASSPMPEAASILRVRGVSKSYGVTRACGTASPDSGAVMAVANVSLNLRRGQISTILGQNGAGKSTLMSILSGVIEADTGHAVIDDALDLLDPADLGHVRIGICQQSDLMFPDLTVAEHVALCARLRAVAAQSCWPLLEALGLDQAAQASTVSTLSPGMRRRLSVAMAFIGSPDLVFLDEPSSGLDPAGRAALWRALQQWKAGRFVILTTHSMDGADLLSDAVVVMDGGRVSASGTPDALRRAYAPGYILTVTLRDSVTDSALFVTDHVCRYLPEATVRQRTPNQVTLLLPDRNVAQFAPMLQSLHAVNGVESFGVSVRSLEEVFLNLLSHGLRQSPGPDSVPGPYTGPYRPRAVTQIGALMAAFLTSWLRDWRALLYQLVMPALYIALGFAYGGVRPVTGRAPATSRSFSDAAIFAGGVVPVTSPALAATLSEFGLHGAVTDPPLDRSLLELPASSVAFDRHQLYHNCSSLHALPAGLALLTNAALSRKVEFRSEPFPAPSRTAPSLIVLLMMAAGLAYVPVGFGIAILRQKGSRRLLSACGLRPSRFWTARLALDLCLYMIPALLAVFSAVLADIVPNPAPYAILVLVLGLGLNGAVVLAFNGWVTSRVQSIPAYSAWASILYLFGAIMLLAVAESGLGLGLALGLTPAPNFVLALALVWVMSPNPDLTTLLPVYVAALLAAALWFALILRTERPPDARRTRLGSDLMIPAGSPDSDPDVRQEADSVTAHYLDVDRYQICVDRVGVDLGQHVIVGGVSFGVGPGRVLGLVGPNGAGKSTLARCLVGEVLPVRGRGRVLDLDLVRDMDQIGQILAYVPQEDALFPLLSAYQHLTLFAHIKGVPRAEVQYVCQRAVALLDLTSCAGRPALTYSGGNKRKLSLGLALLGPNRAVVLDEPTNGLDAHARRLAWDLIASCSPRAGTVLVTHYTREAEHLCDRIAIMCGGRLQCLGTASSLKGRYAGSYQVDLVVDGDGSSDSGRVQAVLDALERGLGQPVQVRAQAGSRVRLRTAELPLGAVAALFAVLVGMQAEGLLQDYAVAQAALDDVLIGFSDGAASSSGSGAATGPYDQAASSPAGPV